MLLMEERFQQFKLTLKNYKNGFTYYFKKFITSSGKL